MPSSLGVLVDVLTAFLDFVIILNTFFWYFCLHNNTEQFHRMVDWSGRDIHILSAGSNFAVTLQMASAGFWNKEEDMWRTKSPNAT